MTGCKRNHYADQATAAAAAVAATAVVGGNEADQGNLARHKGARNILDYCLNKVRR